ncbi:MAG TPA: hypothetical protein VGS19_29445 [Streptosporangiaceae bacterium]|nr:hypothetical protein [Streptosporangiaceae bacterium]
MTDRPLTDRSTTGRYSTGQSLAVRLTVPGMLRVPEVTAYFWVIKALSTAVGESTSDFLVHQMNPVLAVILGFIGFVIALTLQLWVRRYIAWTYWLAVVGVGVFGTMAADVLHVGFHVPYAVSSTLYAIMLAAVFIAWAKTEKTLSIHSIDTARREAFYWAAVVATFAMGTALGDLSAFTLHLGFLRSGMLFAAVIAVPALGYWIFRRAPILCFWFAYVTTRPLGASFADWMGKPQKLGGLGWGDGPVVAMLSVFIFVLVGYLAVTRLDVQQSTASQRVQQATARRRGGAHARPRGTARPPVRHQGRAGHTAYSAPTAHPAPTAQRAPGAEQTYALPKRTPRIRELADDDATG